MSGVVESGRPLRVCVLQPDWRGSDVDFGQWDPPRDLTRWLPGHHVHHEFLDKRTVQRQLRRLAADGYDVFVNLCEGQDDWDTPGVDVIRALDALDLPYTGPSAAVYDLSKPRMKYVASAAGVSTPGHAEIVTSDLPSDPAASAEVIARATSHLPWPRFVKPAHAAESVGIDAGSRVDDLPALVARVRALGRDWPRVLVESYIDGGEVTVLVVGDPSRPGRGAALTPFEYVFSDDERFKTYASKTSALRPDAHRPVADTALAARARDAAERVFASAGGVGYARMDFRVDARGDLYFLEFNFTCSVFYEADAAGSADHILTHDPLGHAGFLARIIDEGIARHARTRRCYALRGDALSGWGVAATRPIAAGEVVWRGEGRAQRLVTRRYVAERWDPADQAVFRAYAVPVSDEVYAIWDEDPAAWAPWNHACDANTAMDGLDVVARRDIAAGEELTFDYAAVLNGEAEPFVCRCGSQGCRGRIAGKAGVSVTAREAARRP